MRGRVLVIVLVLAGCGRVAFDPVSSLDDAATVPDVQPVGCDPVPMCPQDALEIDNNSTSGHGGMIATDHGFAGSCGGNGTTEMSWLVTTTAPGTFTISVPSGGQYLLYVRDRCCDGPELACGPANTAIVLQRQAGAAMVVFLESTPGPVTLRVMGSP